MLKSRESSDKRKEGGRGGKVLLGHEHEHEHYHYQIGIC